MKEMVLTTVGIAPRGDGNVFVLREVDGERVLILGVGYAEATSIAMAAQGVALPRPMTHDLAMHLISRLGGRLQRVLIHEVRDQAFIGQMDIETSKGALEVDARPSDCVALSVRSGVPIYASDGVLEVAGVTQDMIEPNEEGGVD